MTRGDQRDRDRARRLKEQNDAKKGQRSDNKSFLKAKETDSEIMRRKQAESEARKSQQKT